MFDKPIKTTKYSERLNKVCILTIVIYLLSGRDIRNLLLLVWPLIYVVHYSKLKIRD
jgi:hypothetical protein